MKHIAEKKIILPKCTKLGNLLLDFDFETEDIPNNIGDGSVHKINSLNIDEIHKIREAE